VATQIVPAPERADHQAGESGLSEADRRAHELASYVRRRPEPTPDRPPLPAEPAARRRALRVRGW
jgi:hypothetical protein